MVVLNLKSAATSNHQGEWPFVTHLDVQPPVSKHFYGFWAMHHWLVPSGQGQSVTHKKKSSHPHVTHHFTENSLTNTVFLLFVLVHIRQTHASFFFHMEMRVIKMEVALLSESEFKQQVITDRVEGWRWSGAWEHWGAGESRGRVARWREGSARCSGE